MRREAASSALARSGGCREAQPAWRSIGALASTSARCPSRGRSGAIEAARANDVLTPAASPRDGGAQATCATASFRHVDDAARRAPTRPSGGF